MAVNKFKKTQLTSFAKDCAKGAYYMLLGICIAQEVTHDPIGRQLSHDDELLLEVARRFARYTKDESTFTTETGEVQDFTRIIDLIIGCCEENNWFVD